LVRRHGIVKKSAPIREISAKAVCTILDPGKLKKQKLPDVMEKTSGSFQENISKSSGKHFEVFGKTFRSL